jgi:hypothetical protein
MVLNATSNTILGAGILSIKGAANVFIGPTGYITSINATATATLVPGTLNMQDNAGGLIRTYSLGAGVLYVATSTGANLFYAAASATLTVGNNTANSTITPGGLAGVKGNHLRFATEAEDEGIYFCPDAEGGAEVKAQELLDNRPSALSFKIPATLVAGASYHLEVRSRLSGKKLLRGRCSALLTTPAA